LAYSLCITYGEQKFDIGIERYGDKKAAKIKLTAQDRLILKEFISVLELFTEATLRTKGDNTPRINVALPLPFSIESSVS
jgi:hypothetical protein